MAVPTISSVEPAAGNTRGGDIIRIIGTNFRLPDPPAPTGPLMADQDKTVSVQFEGVESEWAYSASAALILARVPQWTGSYKETFPVNLDVRVANLDNTETEIPGENVTLADAYQINRSSLVAKPYLQRVIREVISLFRRHVLENSHHTTSRDYSLTPAQQETLRATGPLIQLIGPRVPSNRFDALNQEEEIADPLGGVNGRMRLKPGVTVDLEFGVAMWANHIYHLQGLVQSLLLFHRDITHVKVAVDPLDPSKGTKDYRFAMPLSEYPDMNTDPTADDLMYSISQSVVRGVTVGEDSGTVIERGWIITQNDGEPTIGIQSS